MRSHRGVPSPLFALFVAMASGCASPVPAPDGGFYDHVSPPLVCAPLGDGFERLGVRTPFYVVSPFAKRQYISHRVHDHSSVLRFLEARFNAGALTRRDANADALLDMFDFNQTPGAAPTVVVPPDPTVHPCDPNACQAREINVARRALHRH